jgi:hypothetical protein
MSLNKKISQAIKEATEKAGKSPEVARRLFAWMEAVTSGNEEPGDQVAAARHLDALYAATVVDSSEAENS